MIEELKKTLAEREEKLAGNAAKDGKWSSQAQGDVLDVLKEIMTHAGFRKYKFLFSLPAVDRCMADMYYHVKKRMPTLEVSLEDFKRIYITAVKAAISSRRQYLQSQGQVKVNGKLAFGSQKTFVLDLMPHFGSFRPNFSFRSPVQVQAHC